jgi:hypothetical protein
MTSEGNGPGHGGPRRGYKWAPFEPGNDVSLKHGAGSRGQTNLSRTGMEVAQGIADGLLGHGQCPPQLLWPQFLPQVQSWSRVEAKAKLLHDWLETMDVEDQVTPKKAGGESPVSVWLAAERAAERARKELGLTPASWAKIQKDLGIAGKATDDALARMAAGGSKIIKDREAGLRVVVDGE